MGVRHDTGRVGVTWPHHGLWLERQRKKQPASKDQQKRGRVGDQGKRKEKIRSKYRYCHS